MEKTFIIAAFAGMAMIVASCGNSFRNDGDLPSNIFNPTPEYNDHSSGQSTQMVSCPMCSGTGVFDYLPGDAFAPKEVCPACEGKGVCSTERAQEAIQAKAQAEAIMNGGYNNGGGYYNGGGYGSGRSAYEIENDLRKAYELLESMEEDYRNCSSGVIKEQYPQMIANQRERIAQLEAELWRVQ